MSHNINIVRIKGVYNALGDLKDTVAFVGGATVSLYADRPDQADVRPTDDIDVLIEIGTYGEYAKIQEKLTELKFHLDSESKVICRYKYQGLTVDIMPTDESVIGFSNKWYKEGFANIVKYKVDERTEVKIFSSPYFIASKLEAFKGRGTNDGRISQVLRTLFLY
jgi:predicted nucleotidyltransferase